MCISVCHILLFELRAFRLKIQRHVLVRGKEKAGNFALLADCPQDPLASLLVVFQSGWYPKDAHRQRVLAQV